MRLLKLGGGGREGCEEDRAVGKPLSAKGFPCWVAVDVTTVTIPSQAFGAEPASDPPVCSYNVALCSCLPGASCLTRETGSGFADRRPLPVYGVYLLSRLQSVGWALQINVNMTVMLST